MDNIASPSINSLVTVIVSALILQEVKLILLKWSILILLIKFEELPKWKSGPDIKS